MGIISDISKDISIERRTKSTSFTLPAPHITITPDDSFPVVHVDVDNAVLPDLLEAVWQAYRGRRDRPAAQTYRGPERRRPHP